MRLWVPLAKDTDLPSGIFSAIARGLGPESGIAQVDQLRAALGAETGSPGAQQLRTRAVRLPSGPGPVGGRTAPT